MIHHSDRGIQYACSEYVAIAVAPVVWTASQRN
jgi:hypothetical protein